MSLVAAVEALLFAADQPVTPAGLVEACEAELDDVESALSALGQRLDQGSGMQLVRIAGGYQLCTRPEFAETVARFLKPQKQRLSRSVMEVLAIVAYKQPVTQAEIDDVRGVQSDYGLKQLLERRLVREVGRKKTPGRPLLYGTTQQFLHQFNMNDLMELPAVNLPSALPSDQEDDEPEAAAMA